MVPTMGLKIVISINFKIIFMCSVTVASLLYLSKYSIAVDIPSSCGMLIVYRNLLII